MQTSFSNRRRKRQSRTSTCARARRVSIVMVPSIVLVAIIAWRRQSSATTASFAQLRNKSKGSPTIVSRRKDVIITGDVKGNLGPASVLNQDPPGQDWIKDRWQAASDMHGTAIKGAHWIIMEFASPITMSYIVLDWEAALSKDYRIEVSSSSNNKNEWSSIFDTNKDTYKSHEYGQSPGVKTKTPLHIIHNITTVYTEASRPLTRIRIWIRSSAHGWGVSLWQVDVYGWYE